jgi:hypothetical protein
MELLEGLRLMWPRDWQFEAASADYIDLRGWRGGQVEHTLLMPFILTKNPWKCHCR